MASNIDNNLFTIQGVEGIIGNKWIEDPTSIVATDVGTFTGWTVTADFLDPFKTASSAVVQTFDVQIDPACSAS